jgi:restriction system protein
VQVKSQDTPVERTVLDQLQGVMTNVGADQGLLMAWGGFKSSVTKVAASKPRWTPQIRPPVDGSNPATTPG